MTSHDTTDDPRDEGGERRDDACPMVERTGVLADHAPAPSPAALERRREALADLARVSSPSLAPLVRALDVTGGVALTHRVPADGLDLDRVRAQAPLRSGHVLAVALALCEALTVLHEAALAHGDVSAERVVIGPDGRARLIGTGLAWQLAPGMIGGPTPEDDVRAVGDLVRHLLGRSSASSALVLAALRASDPDPALRPTIHTLHASLRRAGVPESLLDVLWVTTERSSREAFVPHVVRVGSPDSAGDEVTSPIPWPERDPAPLTVDRSNDVPPRRSVAPARSSARRTRRTPSPRDSGRRVPPAAVVVACAALVVLVGLVRSGTGTAGATGVESRPSMASTTSRSATPANSSAGVVVGLHTSRSTPDAASLDLDRGVADATDWSAVLASLDAGRSRALAGGSLSDLATFVSKGSPAWTADAALVHRIVASSAHLEGGALVVLEVRPVSTSITSTVLLVRDRREPYRVTGANGSQVRPARGERWWRVRLVSSPSGWLIASSAAIAAPA